MADIKQVSKVAYQIQGNGDFQVAGTGIGDYLHDLCREGDAQAGTVDEFLDFAFHVPSVAKGALTGDGTTSRPITGV